MIATPLLEALPPAAARRRATPPPPIARFAWFDDELVPLRTALMRVWNGGPKVVWITLRPGRADRREDDLETTRLTGWSYQAGYGGLILGTLYPIVVPSRKAAARWHAEAATGAGRLSPADTAMRKGAQTVAALARSWGCHDCVVATGALSTAEESLFDDWLDEFRTGCPGIHRWFSLGIDHLGWPLAAVQAGRRAMPDRMALVRWHWPVCAVAGAAAGAPTARPFAAPGRAAHGSDPRSPRIQALIAPR